MKLTDIAVKNRTSIGVLVAIIVLFGAYSYVALPRESAPDVPTPYILITTTYEGVAPEDVESAVTLKIEKKLAGLKGMKEITSASAEGFSLIMAEFMPDVNVDDALQRVKDKVDQARGELPQDVKEPVVTEINIAEFPIMIVNISGGISPVTLKMIADDLRDAFEEIPGVLNAEVSGGLEREIRLEIDPDRVAAYGLTIPEILKLIPSENVNVSAGGLETPGTRFNVRVPAEFREPEEVVYWPLTVRNGKTIYLTDVAKISDTFKDRTTYSRLDGAESITVSVQKRVGANIVTIAEAVKKVLDEARRQAPGGVQFDLTMDRSKDIALMVADLENTIGAALVLVMAVLVVFLGLRTSLIVATAIPLSMLMGFIILWAMGYTLNMIVLFSLILASGMLVDDAIVIVEVIYRHQQMGKSKVKAAMEGAAEVAWPVITSTLTTIAAFLPMIFWPGLIGEFMKFLPITVIITLSCSLFVALVINPTICAIFGATGHPGQRRENRFVRGYRGFLTAALNHRFTTLGLCVLVLVGLGTLYVKRGHGVEFFPDSDPKRAIINIRAPQGTNIAQTDRLTKIIEERIKPYTRPGDPRSLPVLTHVVTGAGSAGGISLKGTSTGPHVGNVTLMFQDYEQRERPSADVVAEIRRHLTDIAGAEVKVDKEKMGPPAGAPVTVRFIGKDFKKLQEFSEKARKEIADLPGMVNLQSDLEAARPELAFRVDRTRAMLLGVNTATIGNFLKTAIFGSKVGTYRQYNDEYDITVRLPVEQRVNIDDLFRLRVPNINGQAVPLSSLGEFSYVGGLGTISRINQKRCVTLTADAEGRLANDVLADVQDRLSSVGPGKVYLTDILDWSKLLFDLDAAGASNRSVVGKRIWELAGRAGCKIIHEAATARELPEEPKHKIVDVLNNVLGRADFFDKASMQDLPLSEQGRALASRWGLAKGPISWLWGGSQKELSKQEYRRLNRLAMEAAYPGVILARPSLPLEQGYDIRYAGEKEEQDKAGRFLFAGALPAALLLITLILVAQFNTLSVPMIIMSEVLLSLIGVLAGLLAAGLPFGIIMTGIGVISLAGIVVKNGIVLLDYTRKLQRGGMDLVPAAIQAGVIRLRPVLLTAGTAILGMAPVALGWSFDFHKFQFIWRSESGQWWRSMAVAIIFGLGFATVLTLVVVPGLYVSVYRLLSRFGLGGLKKAGEDEESLEQLPATQQAQMPAVAETARNG